MEDKRVNTTVTPLGKRPPAKTFIETVEGFGAFEFIYPNMLKELEIEKITSRMLAGDPGATVKGGNIAHMMATLEACTLDSPKGFDLNDLYDYEELYAIYMAYFSQVQSFRSVKKPGSEGEGPPDGEKP